MCPAAPGCQHKAPLRVPVLDGAQDLLSYADPVGRGGDAAYRHTVDGQQGTDTTAHVTKRAERRKPCDHGRQNVPGPLFAEDLFQRCLLRAAPGQKRRPIRCEAHDSKTYGPSHARQDRDIPRFAAKNAARGLCTRHNPCAAAECDMQVMPLVAFDRGRLQNFPLLHRQQQFLFGIPIRLRVQPLRKKLMHKIPPIPAPIYAGMGRKEIEPWTYRSAISSS